MRSVLFSLVLSFASLATADHVNTFAKWGSWTVESGEETWFGKRYDRYPLWQMFDRNPKTAWVYSGTFAKPTESSNQVKVTRKLSDRAWVSLVPEKPVVVDELKFMNGYNKDAKTFKRNLRITEVEIYESWHPGESFKPIRRVRLSDKMGWHSIRLPRHSYSSLYIVATKVNRGTDPDVAISELRLLNGGSDVGPKPAKYALYSEGDECGCACETKLMKSNGKVIRLFTGEEQDTVVSADGRYFAGSGFLKSDYDYQKESQWVTIFDAFKEKAVFHMRLRDTPWWSSYGLHWTAKNVLASEDGEVKTLWSPKK